MQPLLGQTWKHEKMYMINAFHATDLLWYPLKTWENLWFSDVFREYQKRSVAWINYFVKSNNIIFKTNSV